MNHDPAEPSREETQDGLLEEICTALGAGDDGGLTALRARHADKTERFEQLLGVARLYLAGRSELRMETRREGELAAGTRLGDFEILGLLGRGGMGEVYRARQLSLGNREVALKVLSVQLRHQEARARFQREAMLLADLHHPSLAEVYGFGEERREPFLAMRLVEGVDLRALQRQWKQEPGDARDRLELVVRWGSQSAEALALVHANGLVHRDVKPSNIMIEGAGEDSESGGRAVLVDFGLVRPVDSESLTQVSGSPATLEYAPPEQILGQTVGPPADVFALGVTLHDALTGSGPQDRRRAASGLPGLDEVDPRFDQDLSAVIARAVDPESRWRYADGSEFHADLEAWLQGEPVAARKRSLAERVERTLKEHPGNVLRTLAGLGLAAVFLWAAMVVGSRHASVVEAHEALERGDLGAAHEALAVLPNAWRLGSLGWSSRLAKFASDSEAKPQPSSLALVIERLAAHDLSGALHAGASALRLNGMDKESLLLRWWCAGLGEPFQELEVQAREDWAFRLRLTARLMCERPCTTKDELRSAAPLRDVLLELWARPRLTKEDRLFVLSALSGCASKEDLHSLIRWILGFAEDSEEARLGCSSVTRIVMRLTVSDDLKDVDFQGIWKTLASVATPRLEFGANCMSHKTWRYAELTAFDVGVLGLVSRLCRAEARSGNASLVHTIAPESWWPTLEKGGQPTVDLLRWLCWSSDPRVRSAILSLEGEEIWQANPWNAGYFLGIWAGRTLDHQFTARLRVLSGQWSPEGSSPEANQAYFDATLHRVAAELDATPLDTHLDPPTLLGVPLDEQGWRDWDMENLIEQDAGVLAAWDFHRPRPSRGGTAMKVRTLGFEAESDAYGTYYLVGCKLGRSEIRLEYRGQVSTEGMRARLTLAHLSARRDEFPYRGEAYLQVRVDDHLVADGLLVSNEESSFPVWESLALPAKFLNAGNHVLSIRIDPRSTTTYRLLAANLSFL